MRGYGIALASTAIWSASAVFISHLSTRFHMPPLVLAFWRDFLVTCTLAGTLILFAPQHLRLGCPPPARRHVPFFILYGFLLAIFNSLWTISVVLNGPSVATVLGYISPAFTGLIGWYWFDERLTAPKIVAILLSLIGCVFASGANDPTVWQGNAVGIILGLGTGLVFAFYSLMGKASASKNINPWQATLYTFAFGSGFLLLLQRPGTLFWLSRPLAQGPAGWREAALGWGTLLLLAIGPTLGGYGLYTVSLTHLPASTASLILTLEPAMTAVLAFFFLNERLTQSQLVGGAVILAGVFILRFSDRQTVRAHQPVLQD